MVCEKYKEALIEAAVTGEELAPAVRAHLEACANCAEELTQQRSLLATIDGNLHRRMNAPVAIGMLQRLEARVAQEEPPRTLNLSWLYAFAALATTAALILFALPHLHVRKVGSQSAKLVQTAEPKGEQQPQIVPLVLKPATKEEIRRDRMQRHAAVPKVPEVLVPPDERIAMEHFIAGLNGRGEIALARAKRVAEPFEQAIVPVDAPDIQIVALKVQPIRDTAMGSDR